MKRHPSKSARNTSDASPQERRSADRGRLAASSLEFNWPVAAALVVIALAAVAAYCNSFAAPFILDDHVWISKNTSIRHLWPIWQVLYPPHAPLVRGRPVVSLTLAINYALGGKNVWGYHAVNLAIHVLAGWALFGVVRRTLLLPKLRERFNSAATPLALTAAVLWMLHPLQTESVTYIIQRTESLVGLFFLLTIYCVIRAATSNRSMFWGAAATASCLLGMATKELMVTAPLIALLYDRTFLAGSFREAWRRRYGLYLAMAATWGMIAFSVISTGFYGGTAGFGLQKFTAWTYLLTQPGVIVHYLRLSFWPSELCFDYGWPAAHGLDQILLPGIIVMGLLALTVWALVKRPAWGFLGAWFFAILAPTSSFVPIRDAAFEHRMYLSLAAVVVAVVIGVWLAGRRLVDRGTIRPAVLLVLGALLGLSAAIALGTLTYQRNTDYHTALSIWQDAVSKSPWNERAQTNLGLALARAGRSEEAIVHYQKALEVDPTLCEAHYNLGLALAKIGRTDEAIASYERALKLKPDYADAHNDLGIALLRRERLDEAVLHLRQAVKFKPDDAGAQNNLGAALERSGKLDEALVCFRKALKIEPDFDGARKNLADVLGRQRKTE